MAPKGIIGPLNFSPNRLSYGFSRLVLDISQIAIAFHRISPPSFICSNTAEVPSFTRLPALRIDEGVEVR